MARIVDIGAHLVCRHPVCGAGREHVVRFFRRRVEPRVQLVFAQNHRHAIVQIGHEGIRFAGDGRAG